MKNIVNAQDLAGILERVDNLSPQSKALWGQMTVNQALAHMTDQFRMMYGEIQIKDRSSFVSRTVTKWMVLKAENISKDLPTVFEMDQNKGGTPPTTFDEDKSTLKNYLLKFPMKNNHDLELHPFLGKMTIDQFGRLAWQHLDHHLKQFGC
jgi:Protein of unknown function (DUF1569)